MKKLIPIFTLATAVLLSCQSKSSDSENADSTSNTNETETAQCYSYTANRDTASLTLNFENDKVTGSLAYSLYEKDKNNGVVAGIVKGDTILADYTFQAEGTTSIRQVAWLKRNNQLLEGFGEVEEVDGKTQFKNVKKLNFGKSMVFTKTDCK